MLAIDFYYNWRLLKEPFWGIQQLFARSLSLAGDDNRQHTLQMSGVSDKICIKLFTFGFGLTLDHGRICVVDKTFWRGSFRPLGETKLEIKMKKGSVLLVLHINLTTV